MKKYIKYTLAIPLVCLVASCGQKAPSAGSSEVEDTVENILFNDLRSKGINFSEEAELEMVDIIKTKVDDEAQRTDFNFKIKVRDNSNDEWESIPGQFVAAAYYTEDGDLYVEILDSPMQRQQRAEAQMMENMFSF